MTNSIKSKLFGKGISFPPRIGPDGRVAWSEGEQNIREMIQVILTTELQERLMLAEFGCGLRQYLFEPNTTTTRRLIEDSVTRALTNWEPRIELEEIRVEAVPEEPTQALLTITFQLIPGEVSQEMNLQITFNP